MHRPGSEDRDRRQQNFFVYNFSNLELSEAAKSVLNKGLIFCPTPKGVNTTHLLADLFRLERKMAWKHFFWGSENDDYENEPNNNIPNLSRPKKTNLPRNYPPEIKIFADSVKSELA